MVSFTAISGQLDGVIHYSFFLKKTRKLLTGHKYKNYTPVLSKHRNQQTVFVRAPKHFKRGKQKTVFFCGTFLKKFTILNIHDSSLLFNCKHPYTLFNLIRSQLSVSNLSDTYIRRISVTNTYFITLVKWLVFYFRF